MFKETASIRGYSREKTLANFPVGEKAAAESKSHDLIRLGMHVGMSEPFPSSHESITHWVMAFFETIDPTRKKAYTVALARWYASDQMRFLEDAFKARPTIELVQKFSNRLKGLRPLAMSFSDFLDLGDELVAAKSKSESSAEEEQTFYSSGEAELILNTSEWKVVIPKTKEAAIYFGRNTRWCTSAKNANMFDHYNHKGPLYVILNKPTNSRFQFHFETEQFMDERDEALDISEVKKLLRGPMASVWTPEKQRLAVQKSGNAIRYIANPSDEIQKLAVQQDGYAIRHIKNPSKEMQMLAVQKSGYAVRYIENPSEELQKLAVQQYGVAIDFIENPSEELQKLAVQQNGYAIRYIDNPSEEIKKLAVQQDGYAIQYIANPSEEVQKLAVQQDGGVILYIENPSEEVQRQAVQQDGYAIRHIKNPSEEIKKLAVQQDGSVIQYIANPSEEVQKLAVQQNGVALYYITNPSGEVQRLARG